jgi:hypothetical protein
MQEPEQYFIDIFLSSQAKKITPVLPNAGIHWGEDSK